MDCVQSSIQGAVDVVCVKLIWQNWKQYFFHYDGYHTMTGNELQVTSPFFEFLQDYVLRVYTNSVYHPAAHNVTACTVRTDLQTKVFSDTNWQNQSNASTSITEKQSAPQLLAQG